MHLVTAHNPSTAQRVLIIDNEPMITRMLNRMLRNVCDVTVVGDVGDAVAAIEGNSFDAVISDLELGDPDRNGIWLLEQARARLGGIRRVLISGHPITEDMLPENETSIRLLRKPFTYNQLLAAIRVEPM
jgi:DNA-binding NtrC family response regulator